MKTGIITMLMIIVLSAYANVNGQTIRRYSKNDLEKFAGNWTTKVGERTIRLTLKINENFQIKGLDMTFTVLEGAFSLQDVKGNMIDGNLPLPLISHAFVHVTNSNRANGTYYDEIEGLVGEATIVLDPIRRVLSVNLNDPNKGAVRIRAKDDPQYGRKFRVPTKITFTKAPST